MAGRVGAVLAGFLALGLAGCSGSIALYHSAEGGAIAEDRQPPPGSDQPYPNLASVPAAPVALTPVQQAVVHERVTGAAPDVSAPSPGALAGLDLPGAAPPEPDVPGLMVPQVMAEAAVTPVVAPVAQPVRPDSAPVALSFATGSAVLNAETAAALSGLAAARGNGSLLVAGFGEGDDAAALNLALARAQRLANGLTADGVPPGAIRLVAAAAGSGGFVQIVY